MKITALETKLAEIEESRDKTVTRNREILYEIEKTESNNIEEIQNLEDELNSLKLKERDFISKNKDFLTRNERLKT